MVMLVVVVGQVFPHPLALLFVLHHQNLQSLDFHQVVGIPNLLLHLLLMHLLRLGIRQTRRLHLNFGIGFISHCNSTTSNRHCQVPSPLGLRLSFELHAPDHFEIFPKASSRATPSWSGAYLALPFTRKRFLRHWQVLDSHHLLSYYTVNTYCTPCPSIGASYQQLIPNL